MTKKTKNLQESKPYDTKFIIKLVVLGKVQTLAKHISENILQLGLHAPDFYKHITHLINSIAKGQNKRLPLNVALQVASILEPCARASQYGEPYFVARQTHNALIAAALLVRKTKK